jgi:general secretion pathway protein G
VPPRFRASSSRKAVPSDAARHERRQSRSLPESLLATRRLQLIAVLIVTALVGASLLSRARHLPPSGAGRSRENVAARELKNLRIALEHFRQDCGRYPTTEEGLKALVVNPGLPQWKGFYVTLVKRDPWKHPYRYVLSGDTITLLSCGPDGMEKTADDLAPIVDPAEFVRQSEPGSAPSP